MMMVIVYLVQKDYLDLTPEGPHKISIVLAFHQEHNYGYMILITIETLLGDSSNQTSQSVPSNLCAGGLGINLTSANVVIHKFEFFLRDTMNCASYVLGDSSNRTSESMPSNLCARGLGINLTTADVVILHNIEFNPYNVRQA